MKTIVLLILSLFILQSTVYGADNNICDEVTVKDQKRCIDNLSRDELILSFFSFEESTPVSFNDFAENISKKKNINSFVVQIHYQKGPDSLTGLNKCIAGLTQLTKVQIQITSSKTLLNIKELGTTFKDMGNLETLLLEFTYNEQLSDLSPLKNALERNRKLKTLKLHFQTEFYKSYNLSPIKDLLDQNKYETITSYSHFFGNSNEQKEVDLTQYRQAGKLRQYIDLQSREVKDCSNDYCYSCYETEYKCSDCLKSGEKVPACTNQKVCKLAKPFQQLSCISTANNNKLEEITVTSENLSNIDFNFSNLNSYADKINQSAELKKLILNFEGNGTTRKIQSLNGFNNLFKGMINMQELEINFSGNKFDLSTDLGDAFKDLSNLRILKLNLSKNLFSKFSESFIKSIANLGNLSSLTLNLQDNNLANIDKVGSMFANLEKLTYLEINFTGNPIEDVSSLQTTLNNQYSLKTLKVYLQSTSSKEVDVTVPLKIVLDEQKYNTITSYTQDISGGAEILNKDLTKLRGDGKRQYVNLKTGGLADCNNKSCLSCYEEEKKCTACLDTNQSAPKCQSSSLVWLWVLLGIVGGIILIVGGIILFKTLSKKSDDPFIDKSKTNVQLQDKKQNEA